MAGLPPSDAVIASLKVLRNFALDAFSESGLEDERVQEFDKAIVDNLQAAQRVVRGMELAKVSSSYLDIEGRLQCLVVKVHLDWIKASWESVEECVPGVEAQLRTTVTEIVSRIQSLRPGVSGPAARASLLIDIIFVTCWIAAIQYLR